MSDLSILNMRYPCCRSMRRVHKPYKKPGVLPASNCPKCHRRWIVTLAEHSIAGLPCLKATWVETNSRAGKIAGTSPAAQRAKAKQRRTDDRNRRKANA